VELDRVFLMPEGVQVVFAEDAQDPQFDIMEAVGDAVIERLGGAAVGLLGVEFSCEPGRNPATAPPDFEASMMSRIFDPPSL